MTSIGIEAISVFGMPPVDFVALAAELGCQHISTGLTSFDFGVEDHAPYSLRDDARLRRDMIAAMRDTGVSISLGEGCTIRPGVDARDYRADLDLFGELGVQRINTVSMDPDRARTFDQFAVLAELSAERGMVTTTELAPSLTVADLPTALAAVAHVGRPDFRLLIDTMHLGRAGATAADLAALDPALIDYVQVSDAPLQPRFASYFEESMFQRMVPGEGELRLAELLAVLPPERIYALEVPLRAEARAGMGAKERLGRCVRATRDLLAAARSARDAAA
ncbi:sugar phosphate isomerase/epimerase family protein [Novosphingobium piscinae]|uniref:Sugar phosphate isomerase/epimerase n=1 Tax=Novosphingobium piscinae TaxID=1507448 RepID=A0A7X1FZ66_9SPHN|nr:TIM barrel protein [Novosphingobium piscinae]MBC2669549.1 sugar phosphate isomerase/epimerase [Novosphingobium piscinae]